MSNPIAPETICHACKVTIDATDNYCRRCGAPTAGSTAWWESPWVVLVMLFLVLGPLALPMLWRSRRFTRPWKMALSVIVAGLTVAVVWQAWYTLNQAMAPLLQLERSHGF